jgi:hypothetical protein
VEKNYTNHAGENFTLHFPTQHVCMEIVKKVQTHSILIDRKQLKRNRVLNEEQLDGISRQLENSPRKSCSS